MMEIAGALIEWYELHQRDLPWRRTKDPYRIWVAEVILQQTRIQQGLPYYMKFIGSFPDVRSLATAPPDLVLKAWQGLGYYARARNMQDAAREIVEKYGGEFPVEYDQVAGLKGVGEYTAGAIMSFAFNKPYPVIDGNVTRVVSRLRGIREPVDRAAARKVIRGFLEEAIDKRDPATFNQAIMEFGALQCIPLNPDCRACIFRSNCVALREDLVALLPVKTKNLKAQKVSIEYYVFLWKEGNNWMTLIRKRNSGGIWKGLYEFPLTGPETGPASDTSKTLAKILETARWVREIPPVRHVLSHREITARFRLVMLAARPPEDLREVFPVSAGDLQNYPVSRLVENFLERHFFPAIRHTG